MANKESKTTASVISKPAIGRGILVQPRISEKASHLAKDHNKYVFVVGASANKISVARAVEAEYHVKVLGVNIIRNEGKKKMSGRIAGKRSDFKKAVVTLKKGDEIKTAEV